MLRVVDAIVHKIFKTFLTWCVKQFVTRSAYIIHNAALTITAIVLHRMCERHPIYNPDNQQLISRYCTQNDLWSSSRRRYSSDIPAFFHNRPHKLVAHCQKRLEEALLIEEGDIQATESMKVYRVAAVSQAEPYLVDLNVPQCCCYDWRANLYPCKHMFAALHRRKEVFTDLPESYTMNPWFCLDQEVMRVEQQPINDGHENEQSPVKAIDVHRESLEALEKRPRIKLTASSQCRELLQELRSKTYLVHDPSVLQDLKEVLIQEIQRVNRSL